MWLDSRRGALKAAMGSVLCLVLSSSSSQLPDSPITARGMRPSSPKGVTIALPIAGLLIWP